MIGSPSGPFRLVTSLLLTNRKLVFSPPALSFTTIGPVLEGINNRLVSGSKAAPDQLAPPPQPGRLIVPLNVGGV